ncbi:MAG: helix-hairpin-helix domain-containing protein [Solirubrobacterales bacterium]|nr:helix-hairpin-helix domain-containing protein [Solirubrobacterales bacterium]
MSKRFSLVICLAALALTAALPGLAQAADGNGADQAPVTLSDDQISALEEASGQNSGDQSVFQDVSDFVTDNAPFFIIGIVIVAAIVAGIFIVRGRSRPAGPAGSTSGAGQPSAAEMKRRKRAAIQRSREEERLRRKGGADPRRQAPSAAAGLAAGAATGAAVDPVTAEKQAARDQRMAAAAVARSGGAIPAPPSPSQTAPSAAVTATPSAAAPAVGPEPDTVVTEAPQTAPPPAPSGSSEVASETSGAPSAPQTGVALAAGAVAGAAGGAVAGRAASSASPPDEQAPDQAAHDAEARLRAKVEEIKAEQSGSEAAPLAEQQIQRVEELERDLDQVDPLPPLTPGLASVERRLSADSQERDRTLREAEERLRRIERRAEDAERRAAFAERLAQLKIEESDRERRLNEVVSGIDRAEARAREAEARAESAERAAAAALEERSVAPADPPEPGGGGSAGAETGPPPRIQEERPESAPATGPGMFDGRDVGRTGAADRTEGPPLAASSADPDAIDLNSATFEDLRDADLSVTQATRILAYRERFGGYRSVDDLEKVPGFPEDLIESLRGRITV